MAPEDLTAIADLTAQRRHHEHEARRLSDAIKDEAIRLNDAGVTYDQLAPVLGISKQRVGQLVSKRRKQLADDAFLAAVKANPEAIEGATVGALRRIWKRLDHNDRDAIKAWAGRHGYATIAEQMAWPA